MKKGVSDLLLQNDASGRRRLYLAGPKALYQVDLARRQARAVRTGTYTDLAGCNLFSAVAIPAAVPLAAAVWQGRVLDARTRQPLPKARLRVGADTAAGAVRLSPQGGFAYVAAAAAAASRAYPYHASLPGYLPADSSWLALPGATVRDVLLRPLAIGTTVPLAQVRFARGAADLLPASFVALDRLVGLLRTNPGLTIELRGHTDNVGSAAKNLVLSERRVSAAKAYLLSRGIAATRVGGKGFGGSQPAASNAQELSRQRNRRVEFRVTGL